MTLEKEKRILVWFILGVILVTSLPYMVGFASQTDEWRFSGFLVGVDDGNSYIAKMLRGSAGDVIFRSPFTVTPQDGLLVFLPYLWLGKLAAPPAQHAQLVVLFHLFRWLGIWVYVIGINRFIRLFPLTVGYRLLATVLATVGGGTGWLMLFFPGAFPGDGIPLEFLSPETFGFLSIFTLSHLAMGTGLMFFSITSFIQSGMDGLDTKTQTRRIIEGGCFLFLVGWMQSIFAAVGLFIIGIYLFLYLVERGIRSLDVRQWVIKSLIALIPSIGWVVYMLYQSRNDRYLVAWTKQSVAYAQPISYYLFSFGIFILFCVINYRKLRVAIGSLPGKFLVLWVILVPVLVTLPYYFQRRLALGVWVAVIILVLIIVQQYNGTSRRVFTSAMLIFSLPSTVILLVGAFTASRNLASPVFVPIDYVNTYDELGKIGGSQKVLTIFRTGNELPAWTDSYVSLGLGSESVPYPFFEEQAELFFSGRSTSSDRQSWIDEYQIRYAILGDRERNYIKTQPSKITGAKEIFSSGNVSLLEIVP